MKQLALLAVLLLAGNRPDQTCGECEPKKLCRPHAEQVSDGLKEAKAGLKSKEPGERRAALARAGELNQGHANAPAKEVTKLIASALEDDELGIRTQAAELLASGEEPETALKALAGSISDVGRLLGDIKGGHPDSKAVNDFAIAVVRALSSYRDDRSVEALCELLTRHPSAIYGDVVYVLVDGVTELGSREGVEALLGYYSLMESLGSFPELEDHIHGRLGSLAARLELEGYPDGAESDSSAWKDWYEAHEQGFPKKLGKAQLPG